MKTLTLLLSGLTLLMAFPAHAAETSNPEQTQQALAKSNDLRVNVNGLVCDFCARALEKVFSKEEAIQGINVNLDTKIITINFKDGQSLSDENVTQLITDAGYKVENIQHVQ
jgi:copper chaperone CopZ